MIFHENCLLADNSHVISYLIFFLKSRKKLLWPKNLILRFSSKKKTDEGGRFFLFYFYFLKNRREACIYMSCYTLRQCSMGGVLRPLMIFGLVEEPCWTLNQAIFLKNGPSQLHNGRCHYKERHDACIPALNHIKNQ